MDNDIPSRHDQRQQYEVLHNEVADILLGADSPVRGNPEFDESIAEHDRLTKRQAELKTLDAKLVEVLPGLEQAEARLTETTKQLATEKKKLAGFAGELGKAAFAGLRAGELPDHPLFADRKELQSRVESLQRQKAELVADENAGMMEKAKVQVQQLKLTGQIKVEELKIGSLDRALGTSLLTSKEKPSVQCSQTERVLKAIDNQRNQVAIVKEKVKQAEAAVAGRKSAAAGSLGRSTVHDAGSLMSELREARKEHRQNEKGITSIRSSVVATGLTTESLREEPIAGERLHQLRTMQYDLDAKAPPWIMLTKKLSDPLRTSPLGNKYVLFGLTATAVVVAMAFLSYMFSEVAEVPDSGGEVADITGDISTSSISASDAILKLVSLGGRVELDGHLVKESTSPEQLDDWLKHSADDTRVKMDRDTADADLAVIRHLPGLRGLDLSETKVTDSGLVHLEGLSQLEELHLDGTYITNNGLVHLAELRNLDLLDLYNTQVNDEGLEYLQRLDSISAVTVQHTSKWDYSASRVHEHLKGLHLDGKGVTDRAMMYLSKFKNIETLWILDGAEISDEGLSKLKEWPKLREVRVKLGKNGLTASGVKSLKSNAAFDVTIVGSKGASRIARNRGAEPATQSQRTSPRNLAGNDMARKSRGLPESRPRGLERIGCTKADCLICFTQRSEAAVRSHSDRHGFGLCSTCGALYSRYEQLAPKFPNPQSLTPQEQRAAQEFLARIQFYTKQTAQRLSKADPRGQAAALMGFFVAGKFASQEWDTLVGGE